MYPNIPIIVQTAYSSKEDKEKALVAGCDGFISKPIDKEILQNILKKVVA
jgi:CheY-like chemotaxis protein